MSGEIININDIVRTTRLCAKLIMENGGETSRAEETVFRICQAYGFEKTEVFAIPTGLFISVADSSTTINTSLTRMRKRSVNLKIVEKVNAISRNLSAHTITIDDALSQLEVLNEPKAPNKILFIVAAGLASGFFALLFNGSIYDFIAATICGAIVQTVAYFIKFADVYNFAISLIGGLLIASIAVLFITLTGHGDVEKIVAGAIMPLLPGVPMVNAIRDTMRGDLLSGVSRAAEALLIAVALAFGAGFVLRLYLPFA